MTQSPVNIIAGITPAFDYESITVSSTAVSLTETTRKSGDDTAHKAFITIEDDQIRWRVDGQDPTSSEGHLQNPTDTITLSNSSDIRNFRAIRVSSDATIRVTYSI